MSDKSTVDAFRRVLDISQTMLGTSTLSSALPSTPSVDLETPAAPYLTMLQLASPSDALLRTELERRPLTPAVRDALCASFVAHCTRYQQKVTAEHERTRQLLYSAAHASVDVSDMFGAATARFCEKGLDRLRQDCLDLVDARIARFYADAEAAALAEESSESSSEEDVHAVPARGHSAYAVAILEKAYDHAQSVTPAEKQRLAVATGLEARQVTIWVSTERASMQLGRVVRLGIAMECAAGRYAG